ncbi:unnamed protein product [Coffea canephora]|uniref:Protein CHUP1, chloroplastic n=1 Tax=Coffea canephora TaxID=49390 RepID=A0A068TLG8_COFCA|nr:unnamed protein product [Coffea canephora]
MVAGKVKVAMGLQKSPLITPKPKPSSESSPKPAFSSSASSGKQQPSNQKGPGFSRSFGAYFPRSSAQVQPRPPDVAELLRLVEELRERESRLKTELLEQKLLRESIAILPVLESQISNKDVEIEKSKRKIECLEDENERLRQEVEVLHMEISKQNCRYEEKINCLESQVSEMKKSNEELATAVSSSQKQVDFLIKSKSFRKSLSIQTNGQVNVQATVDSSNNGALNLKSEYETKKEDSTLGLVENEKPRHGRRNSDEIVDSSENLMGLKSRAPRVPKPPPRPSSSLLSSCSSSSSASLQISNIPPPPPPPPAPPAAAAVKQAIAPPPPPPPPPSRHSKAAPPPPPPPPPPRGMKPVPAKVRRVPEVVEFYHSLMRRDSRRDTGCGAGGAAEVPAAGATAKDMIGEIENRSTHLLAIKTDVETQGDFIRFLIKEVENAAFTDIEDVVPFVKWLDDELSFLVDERAVLKHFNWPEQKADALREAAFGYCDLKKLESEASSFRDDPRHPCSSALKKMQALFDKVEHGVYNLSRMRESATNRYKGFHIPMEWMLDTGYVSQIKLASVKLAMKYMKRVSAELETVGGGPEEEELIVQGVRFAFRVHQFAGGFDVETMRAFQELRDKARSCHVQCQNQQQHKYLCRSTAY